MGVVEILQLGLNGVAILGGAAIWRLYVQNLKQDKETKQSEIGLLKTDRDIWKDKVRDLEKRSPELIEQALDRRIEILTREIVRLGGDMEKNEDVLEAVKAERAEAQADLERTKGFLKVLELEGRDEQHEAFLDDLLGRNRDIEVVELGEVGVDSGMLMLTDPCYIDSQWVHSPWALSDQLKDPATNLVYVDGQDFDGMDHVMEPYGKTPRELVDSGVLVVQKANDPASYSYDGVMAALDGKGYGELKYRLGHVGAGLVFSTAFGDGGYTVYGEMRNGTLIRIYLNVT